MQENQQKELLEQEIKSLKRHFNEIGNVLYFMDWTINNFGRLNNLYGRGNAFGSDKDQEVLIASLYQKQLKEFIDFKISKFSRYYSDNTERKIDFLRSFFESSNLFFKKQNQSILRSLEKADKNCIILTEEGEEEKERISLIIKEKEKQLQSLK